MLRAVANTENEAAWQRLFDLYAGFVFSIARSKGLNDADADDIVQVVFTDLARNFARQSYQFSPRWTPPAACSAHSSHVQIVELNVSSFCALTRVRLWAYNMLR